MKQLTAEESIDLIASYHGGLSLTTFEYESEKWPGDISASVKCPRCGEYYCTRAKNAASRWLNKHVCRKAGAA